MELPNLTSVDFFAMEETTHNNNNTNNNNNNNITSLEDDAQNTLFFFHDTSDSEDLENNNQNQNQKKNHNNPLSSNLSPLYTNPSNPHYNSLNYNPQNHQNNNNNNIIANNGSTTHLLNHADDRPQQGRRKMRNKGNAVLFISHISPSASLQDVWHLFSVYGTVKNIILYQHPHGYYDLSKKKVVQEGPAVQQELGEGGGLTEGMTARPLLLPYHPQRVPLSSTAFVSYATTKEADNAILSLHDKYSMDGTSRPLQVNYCLKTDKISTFGYQHALQLHALNPSNPLPKIAPHDSERRDSISSSFYGFQTNPTSVYTNTNNNNHHFQNMLPVMQPILYVYPSPYPSSFMMPPQ
ncbi:hypothetical protein, conserved [Angomonas deanei]|uniref:RRM domain-containing protein n=1 Tax=Angomonas deanei TaxID=59799 RepID=A0A7G2CCY3_9TRYP|nr:hypothetical protein, conserved [Angomonas deanei]